MNWAVVNIFQKDKGTSYLVDWFESFRRVGFFDASPFNRGSPADEENDETD